MASFSRIFLHCYLTPILVLTSWNILATPPNIIIVYTDDQSQEDVGYFRQLTGHHSANASMTPNLDDLARDGVAFTQFYTAAPVCTPSRAALLTGKKPESVGLIGNAHGDKGLESDLTMASYFKSKGYRTVLVGKWHLGEKERHHPNNKGFDKFFGHLRGVVDNYTYVTRWPKENPRNHSFDLYENDVLLEQYRGHANNQHLAHLLMNKSAEYIAETDQPLFMYYAINQPHYPVQPLEEPTFDFESPEEKAEAYYEAFVKTIDLMVGRLIDDLDAAGKLNNTIIVFQSDHGHSFESRNWDGIDSEMENERKVFRSEMNYSYRGGKFSTFEGGLRVPAIIRFPDTPAFANSRGIVRNGMAVTLDWFPTLASLVGEKRIPSQYQLEGVNLMDHINDNQVKIRDRYFWHHFGQGFAYREGNLKLLFRPNDSARSTNQQKNYLPGFYLFDLETNLKESLEFDLKHRRKDDFNRMRIAATELYLAACAKVKNGSCKR